MISSQTDICESLNLIELRNEFVNVLYLISLVLSRSVTEINHLKTIDCVGLVAYAVTKWYRPSQNLQLYNCIY
nr:MAG TPA: hypothetical protein [Caudoviricetes sp.]